MNLSQITQKKQKKTENKHIAYYVQNGAQQENNDKGVNSLRSFG